MQLDDELLPVRPGMCDLHPARRAAPGRRPDDRADRGVAEVRPGGRSSRGWGGVVSGRVGRRAVTGRESTRSIRRAKRRQSATCNLHRESRRQSTSSAHTAILVFARSLAAVARGRCRRRLAAVGRLAGAQQRARGQRTSPPSGTSASSTRRPARWQQRVGQERPLGRPARLADLRHARSSPAARSSAPPTTAPAS